MATTIGAVRFFLTSPVAMPTLSFPNISENSRSLSFDKLFTGAVYAALNAVVVHKLSKVGFYNPCLTGSCWSIYNDILASNKRIKGLLLPWVKVSLLCCRVLQEDLILSLQKFLANFQWSSLCLLQLYEAAFVFYFFFDFAFTFKRLKSFFLHRNNSTQMLDL